jgi:hypothetical protein
MKNLPLLFIIVLLISCITLKDLENFTEENDTLVVAQLICISSDPEDEIVNNISDITIFFKDTENDNVIKVLTQNNRLFYIQGLKEGVYSVSFINVVYARGEIKYQMIVIINNYFSVVKGKVNNLGVIIFEIGRKNHDMKSDNYETVKYNFLNRYSKSQWNNIEWVNTLLVNQLLSFTNDKHDQDNENWDIELLDTARNVSYLTTIEKDIIFELNKVRSDPRKYAELYIKPMLNYFDGYLVSVHGVVNF